MVPMVSARMTFDYSDLESGRSVLRIMDSLPALISYVDIDLRYRYNNRAYEEWFGARREELFGRSLEEVLGKAALEVVRPHLEAAFRGEVSTFESVLDYQSAGRRWVRVDYVPDWTPEGLVRGVFALVNDVSEVREAQEAARKRDAEYRAIFEMAGTGKALVDPASRRILAANQTFCEMLGYSREDLLERTVDDITLPEDRRLHDEQVFPAMRWGHGDFELEKRYLRQDGSVFWGHVTVAVVRDGDGRPRLMVSTVVDITSRKQAEQEREQLLVRLQEANQALEESGRQKDRFLAVLAHELRNPLAVVSGAVKAASQDASRMPELVEVLGRNVGLLERLVDDLLDLSRLAGGAVKLALQRVDLAEVVRLGVLDAGPLVTERGHTVDLSAPPVALPVLGDPARLRQIVSNLVGNAARFTDEPGTISVSLSLEGDSYLVQVLDQGIGLDPDVMDRLYEIFGQGEGERGAARGGLGLGLALASQLAELHGGSLTGASPGPGQGSTFTLRLPVPPPSEAVPPGPDLEEAPDCSGMRVLVIDDNRDAAMTMQCLLDLAGAEVELAYDGPSGLGLALARPPDAVVLDLALPRLPGHQVAATLRERGFTGPIVVVSGNGSLEDRRKSMEAGVDLHLVKPADVHALLVYLSASRRPPA